MLEEQVNIYLRTQLEDLCKKYNTTLYLSELKYCSDNAAMIGRVAVEQYKQNDFISIEQIDVQTRIKEFNMGLADKLAFGIGSKLEGNSFDTVKKIKKKNSSLI